VQKLGGKIVYSKVSRTEFLRKIKENGTELQFKLFFDGICAAVYISNFLRQNHTTLSYIFDLVPKFYKTEFELNCPDKNKASVISELMNCYKNLDVDFTDGVKFFADSGWALVIPDDSRSLCKIYVEGKDLETLNKLAEVFKNHVNNIARR
jgi:phosphomannomutase